MVSSAPPHVALGLAVAPEQQNRRCENDTVAWQMTMGTRQAPGSSPAHRLRYMPTPWPYTTLTLDLAVSVLRRAEFSGVGVAAAGFGQSAAVHLCHAGAAATSPNAYQRRRQRMNVHGGQLDGALPCGRARTVSCLSSSVFEGRIRRPLVAVHGEV